MQEIWGIDLGGTKIEGIILESRHSLNVIERLRIPTQASKGYVHIVQRIKTLVELLQENSGLTPKAIGIGTPGTLDPFSQTMKNCNTTVLNDQPLHHDLEKTLRIPVAMANDANCFAVAEAKLGAVPEAVPKAEVVFGVIMGTGIGGGLVINGKVRNGLHGIGGEWGHNFLDASGGDCYCGKSGCVEKVIAGPALEKFYTSISGEKRRLPEILERHFAGTDEAATQTIERLLTQFGKAISVIVNIIDPDAIVLGGGVGNIDLLYTRGREEAEKHLFNDRLKTPFLKPKLGDSAGVFGAALLVD